MASTLVVFPYKFAGGRLSPIVSAGIRLNGQWQVAELYVDSGAFYTLLHATFAASFGFDYKKGRRILMQVGDGGMIPVYLHELPMQLGVIKFQARWVVRSGWALVSICSAASEVLNVVGFAFTNNGK